MSEAKRAELMALADRCEAITTVVQQGYGPTRDIDCRLWCAVNGVLFRKGIAPARPHVGDYGIGTATPQYWAFRTSGGDVSVSNVPRYTASLDAALALCAALLRALAATRKDRP